MARPVKYSENMKRVESALTDDQLKRLEALCTIKGKTKREILGYLLDNIQNSIIVLPID